MHGSRSGATLIELVLALFVLAMLGSTGLAAERQARHTRAVRSAAREAAASFATARRHAIATGRPTALRMDASESRMVVHAGSDTLHRLLVAAAHGVSLTATRDSMAYDPQGLGIGAANLTLILSRHTAAETLVVSRLGRVRR